jgi:thiol-disulfide isomerase/thioredoxin
MLFRSGVSPISKFLHLAAPVAALILLGGCDREKGAGGQAPSPVMQTAPAQPAGAMAVDRSHAGKPVSRAIFFGPDDRPIMLGQFSGAPLLVNLWATWCAPCVAEMPSLDTLAGAEKNRMSVVAVAQDIQGAAVVDPWLEKAKLTHIEAYLDPANKLLADYNSPLPITILFDAAGREVWRITGAVDWQSREAQKLIAEAFAAKGA